MKRPLLENNIDTFIRQNEAVSIVHKVVASGEKRTFDQIVSPQTPFGIVSSFRDFESKPFLNSIKFYTFGYQGYINKEKITKGHSLISGHKVYISKAYGERGSYPYFFLGKPFLGEPNSCCSQSYLVIGPFKTREHSENAISYMKTRFFRSLVMLKKNTQDNMSHVFSLVPLQDFSHPWTDEMLYRKYGLTEDEIAFIESMIRPME